MTRSILGSTFALLAAGMLLTSCSGDPATPAGPAPTESSFALLNRKVIATNCATSGCHVTGSQMAVESGLVLDSAVAYRNLVGVVPKNANALADGLLRVKPGSVDSSLLFHKLHADDGHHHGRDYGNPMPLGGRPLSDGQIEFIRRWIMAGAPETGSVADAKLLDDTTRSGPAPFTPLAAPAQGYQLKIDEFTIQPNFEREIFVHKRIGNTSEIFVNRIETKMRPGSHHLLALLFAPSMPSSLMPPVDAIRDLRKPNNELDESVMQIMDYHRFLGGSMTPNGDYSLPPGVAFRLPANASLDLNSHYVNRTTEPTKGEAYVNLHTIPASQVQHQAREIFYPNMSISIPPHQRRTITKTFDPADEPMRIVLLTSHMHAHGERFVIKIKGGARDGETIYENTDWEHPLIKTFTPALVLQPGESLVSEVTYNNTTDRYLKFGFTSEDEMNIIYGYYY